MKSATPFCAEKAQRARQDRSVPYRLVLRYATPHVAQAVSACDVVPALCPLFLCAEVKLQDCFDFHRILGIQKPQSLLKWHIIISVIDNHFSD